jgi:hypothetical protein
VANALANSLLRYAVVDAMEIGEMSWRIMFSVTKHVSSIAEVEQIILEETCEERAFDALGDPVRADLVSEYFYNKVVSEVNIDVESSITIRFKDNSYIELVPAAFSMDWQWTITPSDQTKRDDLSITSVANEQVWSRVPIKLLNWISEK